MREAITCPGWDHRPGWGACKTLDQSLHTVLANVIHRFRWAKLQVAAIEESGDLPSDLTLVYHRIIAGFYQESQHTQRIVCAALMWLMCAFDPFTVSLWVECTQQAVDGSTSLDADTLLKLCKHLVAWDRKTNVVQFAHDYVRDYLEDYHFSLTDANLMAARACLYAVFSRSGDAHAWRSTIVPGTFMKYATAWAVGHINMCSGGGEAGHSRELTQLQQPLRELEDGSGPVRSYEYFFSILASSKSRGNISGETHVYPAIWEDGPEPGYWSATLTSALTRELGGCRVKVQYDHIDVGTARDIELIGNWRLPRGGITAVFDYQGRGFGLPLSASAACKRRVEAFLHPFEFTLGSFSNTGDLNMRAICIKPKKPRPYSRPTSDTFGGTAEAAGWPFLQVEPSKTQGPEAVSLLDYIYSEPTGAMDFGTMLANIATTKWVEGVLLTMNTNSCRRRCLVFPRPTNCNPEVLNALGSRDSIENPYGILPRRLWDLVNNRVVELDVFARRGDSGEIVMPRVPAGGYWAITHSWASDMEGWMTPVNNYQWPVPLPVGTTLEAIRWEALRAGALYCWLDVLCLRQKMFSEGEPSGEEKVEINEEVRLAEWSIDVPTIGNIYRQATNVLRYFNGLGRQLQLSGWGDPHHWINRAWTLQETRPEYIMVNGGIPTDMIFPLRQIVKFAESEQQMRQVLAPLARIVADAEPENTEDTPLLDSLWSTSINDQIGGHKIAERRALTACCSILNLTCEMARRFARNEIDKIAGLGYLMKCKSLPLYSEGEAPEDAWLRLIAHLPYNSHLELLFNFPNSRDYSREPCQLFPPHWIPRWTQLMELRREEGLELQRQTWPPQWAKEGSMALDPRPVDAQTRKYDPISGALLVPCCARVLLCFNIRLRESPGIYSVSLDTAYDWPPRRDLCFYSPHCGELRGVTSKPGPFSCQYVPISLFRGQEGEGPLPWVVARLLHPDPSEFWDEWEVNGFGHFYKEKLSEQKLEPGPQKILDSFGLTEKQRGQTLLVKKIGVLVTDDMRALEEPDRLNSDTQYVNYAPVVFV